MHHKRNQKNKCRTILPGQSIAEAAIAYRDAIREYEKAQQEYFKIKGNDKNERTEHIKRITKDKAKLVGGSTKSHLKKLLHIEDQRRTNRRIKHALKPNFKKESRMSLSHQKLNMANKTQTSTTMMLIKCGS